MQNVCQWGTERNGTNTDGSLQLFSPVRVVFGACSGPARIGNFRKALYARRCQSESMNRNKSTNTTIGSLGTWFSTFLFANFSLHAEMKVNSCRWCMQIESWRCFYWLIFCIKLHVGAFNSCPKLAAANQRMSIWIMRRMNCQFHVRRQFVHWQFMEFVTERKKKRKCEMPLTLLINPREKQKGSMELETAQNHFIESTKTVFGLFLCNLFVS